MILKIAWRNILRNGRRSLVTLLLAIFCFTLMIFYEAFGTGSRYKMIDDSVAMYAGYLQVLGQGYHDNPNYDHLIYDLEEAESIIAAVDGIRSMAVRLETAALYSTDQESVGGMLVGIQPSKEVNVSRIARSLQSGRFLKDGDKDAAYIGIDLARRLGVGLGGEVVLLSTAVDYSMAATTVKVVGIFQTSFYDFDSRAMFINKAFMDYEFLAENMASHIIIEPEDNSKVEAVQSALVAALDPNVYEPITWRTTMSDLVQFMQIDSVMDYLSFMLLLIVVFFVIMIFSLISIFQRQKEIGIMRAIGTSQWQMYKVLFAEIIILTIIGFIIGGSLGVYLSLFFQANPIEIPIDPELMEIYSQYGIYDLVFPTRFNLKTFLSGTLPVFFLMISAVFYPAWRVNQMNPIDAIEER